MKRTALDVSITLIKQDLIAPASQPCEYRSEQDSLTQPQSLLDSVPMTDNMDQNGAAGGIQITLETLYTELQNLRVTTQALQAENQNLRALIAQVQAAPPGAALVPVKSPVGLPVRGQSKQFAMFLAQCELYIQVRQAEFLMDDAKVAFIISLLEGEAAKWATLYLIRNDPVLRQFVTFKDGDGGDVPGPTEEGDGGPPTRNPTTGKVRVLSQEMDYNDPALMYLY
ncbi:protein LDOC1-like [Rhineura floridana]|uniref:protein LDOC1-like n=1 Tax=Rhineura floridana TaxID=261503 RepID=UPI002AC852C3|nr:protein LDOC1-like [Rhineura floridana]